MNKCKVITVENQKGGTAKTTTVLNLGVGLHQQGKKVLLIDADPQGSLTISLGIDQPDELPISLATLMQDIIDDNPLPDDYGIVKTGEGIDLVPANIELSGLEVNLFNAMSREYVLKNYIEQVKGKYDYCLIDCTPSLGFLPINALVAADSLIIPLQPSYLSTKGLDLLMRSYSKIKRTINPGIKIDGILFTMVDYRTNNDKSVVMSMRETVGQHIKVFDTAIPHSVRAAESNANGKSIFAYDKNCKVAEAYRDLTREVMAIEHREKNKLRSESVR